MIGETLGNYTVLESVGSGAMGTVYRAENAGGDPVALKRISSKILYSMEKREQFLQCVLAASQIRHKGLCPILEIGDENDDFYIITPFLKGDRLDHYISQGAVPITRTMEIARAIASTLEAVHKAGTVHRGIKPSNIWIPDDGEADIVLSDCCISRFTEISRPGKANWGVNFADTLIPLGALGYMSPEQVRGEQVDYRTDIFSFGVILYEMMMGIHPFHARTSLSRIIAILEHPPARLGSRMNPVLIQFASILHKALAKNKSERYQSIGALISDLNDVYCDEDQPLDKPSLRKGLLKFFFRRF